MRQSQHFAALLIDRVMEGVALPDAMEKLAFDQLPPAVKPFVMELTLGTLRQWGLCSTLVDSIAARHVTPASLRALLSVAIFQLMFMKQPPFAVVDQAVRAAGENNPFAKSFANALLRRFLREKDAVIAKVGERPLAKYSYPRWWIDKIRAAYPERFSEILLAQNTPPTITIRVNRRQCARDPYLAILEKANIPAIPTGEFGVMLAAATDVTKLPHFLDGFFSVQDASAQHAARLLDLKDGQRVLDAACAPGGKTTHILESASVFLTAVDCDKTRMTRVPENIARLRLDKNLPPVTYHIADAGKPKTWWDGRLFDRILLDAPCSGSGVARRHPDAKWLKRESDIAALGKRQLALLQALWDLLTPEGKLVYATCSLFPTENEEVIAAFCEGRKDVSREEIIWGEEGISSTPTRLGNQLLPIASSAFNQDGLFYAVLKKAHSE